MSEQRDLFGQPSGPAWTPHQRGSETSLRAAASMAPRAAKTVRTKVLEHLRRRASTDEELCDALRLGANTVRPRRIDLVSKGLVEDSGETRPTRSGRLATVWRARA